MNSDQFLLSLINYFIILAFIKKLVIKIKFQQMHTHSLNKSVKMFLVALILGLVILKVFSLKLKASLLVTQRWFRLLKAGCGSLLLLIVARLLYHFNKFTQITPMAFY